MNFLIGVIFHYYRSFARGLDHSFVFIRAGGLNLVQQMLRQAGCAAGCRRSKSPCRSPARSPAAARCRSAGRASRQSSPTIPSGATKIKCWATERAIYLGPLDAKDHHRGTDHDERHQRADVHHLLQFMIGVNAATRQITTPVAMWRCAACGNADGPCRRLAAAVRRGPWP